MANALVGVTGGIAAYKAVGVVRALIKAGWHVRVIPTADALQMVGKATWEALTGEPVRTGVFEDAQHVDHIEAARKADVALVVPATANVLAKMACGIADDLLSTTLLALTCPLVVVPAMHTQMWEHPATQTNVDTLRTRGVRVVTPAQGDLSSGDSGRGRLPDEATILFHLKAALRKQSLRGYKAAVSAGGTREPLDPVRWIGNRSSGRMGASIASELAAAGAEVTFVGANVEDAIVPAGTRVVSVASTAELEEAMLAAQAECDILVQCAAVADFTPKTVSAGTIKKTPADTMVLELTKNPDILAELAQNRRPGQLVVGFAAETGTPTEVAQLGKEKARRKGADLLVINQVGDTAGFGDVDTTITLVDAKGQQLGSAQGPKDVVARAVVEEISTLASKC